MITDTKNRVGSAATTVAARLNMAGRFSPFG
jgi:hypothetical protein